MLGRSPGRGHGNPLQYSCLENPHRQRRLVGCSPWSRKESDMTEQLSTHPCTWTRYKKIKKKKKHQMPLLKSYEQKQHVGSKSRVLLMSSAPSTTEGVGTPPKPALRLLLGPAPILTPMRNELTPLQGRSKGTCCLFLLPPAAVEAPVKLCLNFLSGLQSISIDQGGQELW